MRVLVDGMRREDQERPPLRWMPWTPMCDEAAAVTAKNAAGRNIRVRGRGARMLMCRWAGIVVPAASAFSYSVGKLAAGSVAVALILTALWQLWLFRPGITVDGSVVRLRGLISTEVISVEDVRSFGIAHHRRPMDYLEREVCVVIHLHDGADVLWSWVGWRDLISAWLVKAERPLRLSQRRVLDRLNGALPSS